MARDDLVIIGCIFVILMYAVYLLCCQVCCICM